jgi:hypothetical protein
LEALGRVRDARGDDEAKRRERILREALNADESGDFDALVVCVRAVDAVRADLDAENTRLRTRTRELEQHIDKMHERIEFLSSPQGEDHEAGIRAMLAEAEGRGLRMRTDDGAEVAAMDEADVRALAAAYLSRVSPSRDGTVAVEDVARLVEALRNFGIHAETCPRHRLFAECTCGLEAVLAEFGSARADESNEGGNQNDERRH